MSYGASTANQPLRNKNHERKKNRQDGQNSSGVGHREGVKACELIEVDSHAVQEKRASKGNTTDDSQLIVMGERNRPMISDDKIGRAHV